MVVGLTVMLPVSAAHVVPLVMADECPSPLKCRDTPKKYGGCGTANATPKYDDIAPELPIQSSLQNHDISSGNPLSVNSKKNRGHKSESNLFQSSYLESTTTPHFRDDQDMIRNHQKIEKAGPTSSLSTPPIIQPAQNRISEEAIIKRSSEVKVEASLDKLTRIPFAETTANVANHRKGGYTPISLEVWQTLTWTPHVKQIVVSGKCLRSKIVSDVNATRHLKSSGKSHRKAVNIVQIETDAEIMQRKFLL